MSSVRPLWRSLIDALVFFSVLVLVLLALEYFGTSKIATGKIVVIDGDSLREGTTEIRLFGIDAPEYYQSCRDFRKVTFACGKRAAEELRQLVSHGKVECITRENDRYGRAVSHCRNGKTDINLEMVRSGWAVAYLKYGTEYADTEEEAHKARRGLWAGTFDDPEKYRELQRAVQSDVAGTTVIEPD